MDPLDDKLPITYFQRARLLDFVEHVDRSLGDSTFDRNDELPDCSMVFQRYQARPWLLLQGKLGLSCHLPSSLDALGKSMETEDATLDLPEFVSAECSKDGATLIGFELIALASLVYAARRDSGPFTFIC